MTILNCITPQLAQILLCFQWIIFHEPTDHFYCFPKQLGNNGYGINLKYNKITISAPKYIPLELERNQNCTCMVLPSCPSVQPKQMNIFVILMNFFCMKY